jgi:putative tryptophan/tyrosine transport system substrate-binding protein
VPDDNSKHSRWRFLFDWRYLILFAIFMGGVLDTLINSPNTRNIFFGVVAGYIVGRSSPRGRSSEAEEQAAMLSAKRLELLHEMVPAVTTIGVLLASRIDENSERREVETAARILGVRLVILDVTTSSEIEAAFSILVGHRIGALLVGSGNVFGSRIVPFAARHQIPAIYNVRQNVEAGGLMSYGANIFDAWRLAGRYAGRILKVEKPAALPVQQPTKVELIINLRTAKALGLTVPETLLATADEVIQ